MNLIHRLRDWWFGAPVYWCRYGHHWTRQQPQKPTHYTGWFCRSCFDKWWDRYDGGAR